VKLLKNGLKGEENMKNLEKMKVLEKRSPKIFLSGSIRGGRQLLETYRFMFDTLEEEGAEVLSWHVVDPELENVEMRMTEEEIYARDMGLLVKSDALIAEVTVPSTGVGYEICRALVQKIPVLCLYSSNVAVSAMVLGNPDSLLETKVYQDKTSLKNIITEFIRRF
jgi:2'-deoxynucleoside 5'-phosphate N-hydrolase